MKKRPYRKRQRALQQSETRSRIVEAAMQLHGEVGPRYSSIKAIAERAGVQRLTVYRHFNDEAELFQSCSAHWLELNPPPAPSSWQAGAEPMRRIEKALAAFSTYYSRTAYMWEKVYRDLPLTDALVDPMNNFHDSLDRLATDLLPRGLRGKRRKRIISTLAHALSFPAWQALERLRLGDRDKVGLYLCWIRGCEAAQR